MKNNLLFLAMVGGLLLLASCSTEVNIDELLQNETTRQQVFEKIAGDHEMMTAFMGITKRNEHASMMMKGHEIMKDIMGEMMKDGKLMEQMVQMMGQEGMMSEECMQSCMKMMGEMGAGMDNMTENGHDGN